MIKTILLLTPNPDHPSHHGRWPYVLEAYQQALSATGADIIDAPWPDAPEIEADLILPLICWGYHNAPEAFRAVMARLQAQGRRVFNPADIISWNVDKHYLRDLAETGVRIVPSLFAPRLTGAVFEQARADFGERIVIKPVISAGAKQTAVWEIPPQLAGEGDRATTDASGREAVVGFLSSNAEALPSGPCLIQPFMPAIQTEGEWSLIFLGGAFSHAVLKTPKAGDFRSQPDYEAHLRALPPPPEALELAEAAIAYVGHGLLYARVDMVRDAQGRFCLMELELIEPDLYLGYEDGAAERLCEAVEATASHRCGCHC